MPLPVGDGPSHGCYAIAVHPNTFLRTFWRTDMRPDVFVAMSFDDAYRERFEKVIAPAIGAIEFDGSVLTARRVDLSKSGDSILTDIIDGIAHSAMVLGDVSVIGHDSKTGKASRNGNVMYEVGLALACRQSSEVLLIRDDKAPFLFDVSTVPHMHIDFADVVKARTQLTDALRDRLHEVEHFKDARLAMAAATLTSQERTLLRTVAQMGADRTFWPKKESLAMLATIPRLLDKQLIRAAFVSDGKLMFACTALGRALAENIDKALPEWRPSEKDLRDAILGLTVAIENNEDAE